jgi:hypothetical protein
MVERYNERVDAWMSGGHRIARQPAYLHSPEVSAFDARQVRIADNQTLFRSLNRLALL